MVSRSGRAIAAGRSTRYHHWPTTEIVDGDRAEGVGVVEAADLEEPPGGRVNDDGGLATSGPRGKALTGFAVMGRYWSEGGDAGQEGDRLVERGVELWGGADSWSDQEHGGPLEAWVGGCLVGQQLVQDGDACGRGLEFVGQGRDR